MAGIGGKMPGAGRPKGSKNKSTIEIKTIAQKHSKKAIDKLVELMNSKDISPQTQLAAATSLLDRAHGKPSQAVTNDDGTKLFPERIEIVTVSPKDN
jgi:hypothetical protein